MTKTEVTQRLREIERDLAFMQSGYEGYELDFPTSSH
jgi:hypothetical protein